LRPKFSSIRKSLNCKALRAWLRVVATPNLRFRRLLISCKQALMTRRPLFLVLILLALAPVCLPSTQPEHPIDPAALVHHAVQQRLDATRTHRPLRYLLRKKDEQHDTTKDIIETADGAVARLVAMNGQPLSAQANQAELERLNTLTNHPEVQEHRHQREQKDAERADRLMRLLPDAFLYRFEGMADCAPRQAGAGAEPCYHLSFSPNPRFDPPDLEASILRGMSGEVWIDHAQERLTRLDAHFIKDVDFGWGIIGRLDKGGTIHLEQADIGGNDWEATAMKLDMRGKALMVKTLSIQITQEASHFSLVPPGVDYRKAIQLLENSGGAP
jgi:hypothetical protein